MHSGSLDLSHLNGPQLEAVRFGDGPLAIIAAAGCITGDTIINFNRNKKGYKLPIEKAYGNFTHTCRNKTHFWDLDKPTFVRALQGNIIKLHEIDAIVKSGIKIVYRLTLDNGFYIDATSNHKIMTSEGFVELGKLNNSKMVMCDSNLTSKSNKTSEKKRYKEVRGLVSHPYGREAKRHGLRVETHRLIYEAFINDLSLDDFVLLLKKPRKERKALKFINSKFYDVHHVDHDHLNNSLSNLVRLTRSDHKKLHKNYGNFSQGVPKYFGVKSITKIGKKMTYDIQCKAPFHNFVANGIVIHNSGKTRCITYRIAEMIELGIPASKIFVTTFTKRAAEEMTERLEQIIGESKTYSLKIGTFHSLLYSIYKTGLDYLERGEAPKLLLGGGRYMVMKKIMKDNRFISENAKGQLKQISLWKNEGLSPVEVHKLFPAKKANSQQLELVKGFKLYEAHKKVHERIDFDDMMTRPYEMMRDNPYFLEKIKKKYKYILVDEGQDLNKIQFDVVTLMAGTNKNVSIVFDDFQGIFSFRGGELKHLKHFLNVMKPKLIKLEQNYRSTKTIVHHAGNLIKHNPDQIKKNVFTKNLKGDEVSILLASDEDGEALLIGDTIGGLIGDGYSLDDMAILYRTNNQARALVDMLMCEKIPHKVYGKFGFYDRPEVKDIISYLKIIIAPYEANLLDFKNAILRPTKFLGHEFINKIEELQIAMDYDTYWQALENCNESSNIKDWQIDKCLDFVQMIKNLEESVDKVSPGELIEKILWESGYLDWLNAGDNIEEEEPDNDKKINVESLINGANQFDNVWDYLNFVKDMLSYDGPEEAHVKLMTCHASKGKEFSVTFVAGLCEKLLPHSRANDVEEERRIAYVAITRAKDKLFLGTIRGKYNNKKVVPSRFIREMGLTLPGEIHG